MSEDSVKRLFERFDNLNARLARIEVKNDMIEESLRNIQQSIKDQGSRLGKLEQARAGASGIKDFIPWIVTLAAMVWGMVK